MGILDSLLSQVSSNVDIANLATKVGIDPDQAEAAVQALGQAHGAPGDTVETAASTTGLPPEVLQQIVDHIGGEGSLGEFASLLRGQGESGGLLGQVGSLFGGKS
jgi:hypothetical protein